MEFSFLNGKLADFDSDALVVFLNTIDAKQNSAIKFKSSHPEVGSLVQRAAEDEVIAGKMNEIRLFRYALNENTQDLVVVGAGPKKGFNAESMRQLGASLVRSLNANSINSATIDLQSLNIRNINPAFVQAFVEGIELGNYVYKGIKSAPPTEKVELESVEFFGIKKNATFKKAINNGEITANSVNFSRELGDTPGNFMTPTILGERVKAAAKGSKLKVTTWDKARLEKEKMGGILGVSAGSSEEPRLIIMQYNGAAKTKKPVCFVGKGLTFDCGGISLKPAPKMDEMKYDMCGGANVIGALLAIAKLGLKVNALGIVASSENLVGPAACKPGDVLTFRNGKTAEILNTDAEGRLILADALSYASEKSPAFVVDAATLTGAMAVALGNIYTGYFSRDAKLTSLINKAGSQSGEKVWNLPLDPEHTKDLASRSADLRNIGVTNGAGSSTAAAFLSEFVEESIPWAHFDIAGTAWDAGGRLTHNPKHGATGSMVRTFVELAKIHG